MKYVITRFIFCVLSVLALISCVREDASDQPEVPTTIKIVTRASLFPSDPDQKITSLRVMAFSPARGIVRSNVYYPADSLRSVITHPMFSGFYDFVILANEPQGEIHQALDNIVTRNDLNSISFPASAFNSVDGIPMILFEDGVVVLGSSQGLRVRRSATISTWDVVLERMAVRIDMILRSETDLTSSFAGVAFDNLPDSVPLQGNYSGPHTSGKTFLVSAPEDAVHFRDTTIAGVTWAKKIQRVILPANVFSPANTPQRVVAFSLLLNDAIPLSTTIGVDEPGGDYTLPRNKFITVEGIVDFPMEINLSVADWVSEFPDGITMKRLLNVSDIQTHVYDGAVTRLYFWSDQPSAVIENSGFTGLSGTTPFTVNTVFYNLAGSGSPNLTYDPVSGMGHIDIAALSNTSGTTSYRIILNANGLKREITVTNIMTSPPAWGSVPYVGTFHRWNQTGERIISSSNSGPWTAEVISGDFIILSRTPSPASIQGILGTLNPGDAEKYQVPGDATSVSGNGRIFFRVGLTGAAPSPDIPRYGLIRVTSSNGTVIRYIYVRQGEAPDVVNSDIKWSPYNLSDPLRGLGGPNATDHSLFTPQAPVVPTTFADYPTQVGYMFRWNLYNPTETGTNRAWSPRNPPETNSERIVGYPSEIAEVWNTANDPCPAGYRHPTPAEFLNLAPDAGNSNWGFYADGFFDRGTIVSGADFTGVMGALNYQFGTYGRLFYNAATNAAIFMPVAGTRVFGANNGYLQYSTFGSYPTSNLSGNGNVIILLFSNGTVSQNSENYNPGRALAVRCVKAGLLFTISFDSQGGSLTPNISGPAGAIVVLPPAPTRPSYRFAGWNTQPDGTGVTYSAGEPVAMQPLNMTLYAQWEIILSDNSVIK